jgi:hypothetical protein
MSSGPQKPSRAELLESGGLYPVPLPLTWQLIGEDGEPTALPKEEGSSFHRLLAKGALLAVESGNRAEPGTMMLRQYSLSGPVTADFVARYGDAQLKALREQGLAPTVQTRGVSSSAFSAEPCLKLHLLRNHMNDSRAAFHYVLRDRAGKAWELVYLVRRDELDAWKPLLAEIDGPPGA